jgi:anti-sigma factor RsiW
VTQVSALAITLHDLHANADRQLDRDRRAAVERVLAKDPAAAATVTVIRRQNAHLHDAFDACLTEAVPARLLAAVMRAPERRWHRRVLPFFAATATLMLGISVGWLARDVVLERDGTPTSFARQAALTHALYSMDANRPVEVWASEEKRLVAWLSRRLGFTVHAPDLNAVGYALVGGRLVAGNQQPTALFMYESPDKQRLTLQVRKQLGVGETAFRYAIEDGVGVYYWIDDKSSYALSGNVDCTQLLAIGRLVYGQLAAADSSLH